MRTTGPFRIPICFHLLGMEKGRAEAGALSPKTLRAFLPYSPPALPSYSAPSASSLDLKGAGACCSPEGDLAGDCPGSGRLLGVLIRAGLPSHSPLPAPTNPASIPS